MTILLLAILILKNPAIKESITLQKQKLFVVASTGIVTRTTILLIVDPYSQGGKDLKLA
jgi:hypothetical protein